MSLEQSVALALSELGLAREAVNRVATTANTQIARVGTHYDGIVASQSVTVYVDQTTGVDTNNGAVATPYKTVEKALSVTPKGGLCSVYLLSDYHVASNISVNNCTLNIYGGNNIRRKITFGVFTFGSSTVYRACYGFRVSGLCNINLKTVRLVVPEIGSNSALALGHSCLFNYSGSNNYSPLVLTISSSEIELPATPFCAIVANSLLLLLTISACTYPGATTSPLGWISQSQPNTAGVATAGLPWVITNLSTI